MTQSRAVVEHARQLAWVGTKQLARDTRQNRAANTRQSTEEIKVMQESTFGKVRGRMEVALAIILAASLDPWIGKKPVCRWQARPGLRRLSWHDSRGS